MAQLVLSVHTGIHDAAAAVFEDYSLRAAVSLERLTRYKNDGRAYPDACIDEVLGIVGAARKDVDAIGWSPAAPVANPAHSPTEWRPGTAEAAKGGGETLKAWAERQRVPGPVDHL